jgi:hypothetical protein
MRSQIGYGVAGGDEIITDMPFEQLMLIMSSARFASSDQECADVARLVHHIIGRPNVLPLVSIHSGMELASRCLVSLALFRTAMAARTKHHACPPPSYYRQAGIRTLTNIEMKGVSAHFDSWSGFIGETLGC